MPAALELLFPAVRGLIAATLILLVGTPMAGAIARRHGPAPGVTGHAVINGWFERLPGLLAWCLLTCSLLRGALQLLSFAEPGEPISADLMRAVLMEGSWAAAWIAQSVAAFLLLVISWRWRSRPDRLLPATVALLLIAVAAEGGLGHGADDLWPGILGRAVHAVHLIGSGLWLGTLAILALAVFPSLKGNAALAEVLAVLVAFSRQARLGVFLVITTGLMATFRYTSGRVLELPSAAWGQLLLIKLVLVGGVMLLGWWNWRRGTPALLAHEAGAASRLRLAITVELLLGGMILLLTAWLVSSPLPAR